MTGSGQFQGGTAESFVGGLANSLEREPEGKPLKVSNAEGAADNGIGGCKGHLVSQK